MGCSSVLLQAGLECSYSWTSVRCVTSSRPSLGSLKMLELVAGIGCVGAVSDAFPADLPTLENLWPASWREQGRSVSVLSVGRFKGQILQIVLTRGQMEGILDTFDICSY